MSGTHPKSRLNGDRTRDLEDRKEIWARKLIDREYSQSRHKRRTNSGFWVRVSQILERRPSFVAEMRQYMQYGNHPTNYEIIPPTKKS